MIAKDAQQTARIRYAVVGLGHIAQAAVLPAFRHAKETSVLTALVSDDPAKLQKLGKKYRVPHTYDYAHYDQCLHNDVDAIYIALPNHLHCEYTQRALNAGRHVLCEKPMAVTSAECQQMIDTAAARHVRLMIAYRLHFEEATLHAIELARSGILGDLRYFESSFSMQVREGNIRTDAAKGGGPLPDIGIYCLNAARHLFAAEPAEVFATSQSSSDPRFREVDEMVTAVLTFPGGRVATFTCSFGAADVSSYRIVGSKGDLRVEPAYAYTDKLVHHLTVDGKTVRKTFSKRDQFAAELEYFSRCLLSGEQPEPSGVEGLADVRIIEALQRSALERVPHQVPDMPHRPVLSKAQEIRKPPHGEPPLVHASAPSD